MRRISLLGTVVTVTLLAALSACSGDGPTARSEEASDAAPSAGQTWEQGSDTPNPTLPDFCSVLAPDAVSAIIGEGSLAATPMPHDTCGFEPSDARNTYVAVSALADNASTGGIENYRSGTLMMFDDPQISDPGIGTASFLALGTVGASSGPQLQAAADVDGLIIAVSISPVAGVDPSVLEAWGKQLLELAVAAL